METKTTEHEDLVAQIQQLKEENVRLLRENASLTVKSVKVYEENSLIKANPVIAAQKAEMDYMLAMADRFIKSVAFNCPNAEQAYTKIMAGKEMGLTPVESMNALYIVNGSINPYGKFMVSRLTNAGYKIEYLNETDSGVTVRVTNASGFEVTEVVRDQDQILQRSKAMGFAKKNKMRFHGIRMVVNFHLAHLFGSVSDMFVEDYTEQKPQIEIGTAKVEAVGQQKQRDRIIAWINQSKTIYQLREVLDTIASMKDNELMEMYEDRQMLIEEYGLCMTEIEQDIEALNTAEDFNSFLNSLNMYQHVLSSEADAIRLLELRAQQCELLWNNETKTYNDQPL